MSALRSLRSRVLEPLRRYVVHHSTVDSQNDAIGDVGVRLDGIEHQLTDLVAAVAALQAMADLPRTMQEVVATLVERIETLERTCPSGGADTIS